MSQLLSAHRRLVIVAAVAIVMVLALVLILGHSGGRTNPSGVGIAKRGPVDLHGVATGTANDCFSGTVVAPAGRVAAVQHYSLTLILRATPSGAADLVTQLSQSGCIAAEKKIVADVTKALSIDPKSIALVVSFRLPDGSRIVLPA